MTTPGRPCCSLGRGSFSEWSVELLLEGALKSESCSFLEGAWRNPHTSSVAPWHLQKTEFVRPRPLSGTISNTWACLHGPSFDPAPARAQIIQILDMYPPGQGLSVAGRADGKQRGSKYVVAAPLGISTFHRFNFTAPAEGGDP